MANTNRRYTFISIQDIYDTEEDGSENPKLILIKENAKLEFTCLLDDIKTVKEYTDKEGNIIKDQTRILHEFEGQLIVKGNHKDISDMVFGKIEIHEMGFTKKKQTNKTE